MTSRNAEVETRYVELFSRAAGRGDASAAVDLASRAAKHYEKSGNAEFTGIWTSKLSIALYWQGEHRQSVKTAQVSVNIQPNLRERARAKAWLAAMHCVVFDTEAASNGVHDAQ